MKIKYVLLESKNSPGIPVPPAGLLVNLYDGNQEIATSWYGLKKSLLYSVSSTDINFHTRIRKVISCAKVFRFEPKANYELGVLDKVDSFLRSTILEMLPNFLDKYPGLEQRHSLLKKIANYENGATIRYALPYDECGWYPHDARFSTSDLGSFQLMQVLEDFGEADEISTEPPPAATSQITGAAQANAIGGMSINQPPWAFQATDFSACIGSNAQVAAPKPTGRKARIPQRMKLYAIPLPLP